MKEENNSEKIKQILIDMVYCTQIEVYRKHGVGLQTQNQIKQSIVSSFLEETAKNSCRLCRKKIEFIK